MTIYVQTKAQNIYFHYTYFHSSYFRRKKNAISLPSTALACANDHAKFHFFKEKLTYTNVKYLKKELNCVFYCKHGLRYSRLPVGISFYFVYVKHVLHYNNILMHIHNTGSEVQVISLEKFKF